MGGVDYRALADNPTQLLVWAADQSLDGWALISGADKRITAARAKAQRWEESQGDAAALGAEWESASCDAARAKHAARRAYELEVCAVAVRNYQRIRAFGEQALNVSRTAGWAQEQVRTHGSRAKQVIGHALAEELHKLYGEHGQPALVFEPYPAAPATAAPAGREASGITHGVGEGGEASDARARAKAIADGSEPLPLDQKELHDFWSSLDKDEKDAVYGRYHNIGNYDGLPSSDRDHYNRRHLGEIGGHVADEVGKNIGPEGPNGRKLLYVDPQGHTAVATRDPDKSKNVVVFVPGMGTSLDGVDMGLLGHGIGLGKGMEICAQIQRAADYASGSKNTAVVYWDNYDAPSGLPGAVGDSAAKAGAPKLDAFLDGLHTSHDDHNYGIGHYTVEGWSYGSTLVGEAASHGRSLNTDEVIDVASPGMDVSHATDLHLTGHDPNTWNAQHVHATADAGDPVVQGINIGSIPAVPLNPLGPLAPLLPSIIHGTLPTDPSFGGQVFDTAPHYDPRTAHNEYWDSQDNPGLKEQGRIIVTGPMRDEVLPPQTAPPREAYPGDSIPVPPGTGKDNMPAPDYPTHGTS